MDRAEAAMSLVAIGLQENGFAARALQGYSRRAF
jgi:hypothetical protein